VTVECFFDYSSPRTYLGFHQLHEMRAQYPNVAFVFRPMLVGGIFNSVNPFVSAIPLASR
jgi:2-hydroxychromene-2-carboxylate isomerase